MDRTYDTEMVVSPGLVKIEHCPWMDVYGTQACFFMYTVALAFRKYGFVTPESRYWFHQGYQKVLLELFNARNSIGRIPRLPIHARLVHDLNSHMPPEHPTVIVMLENVMKALEHYDILSRGVALSAPAVPPTPVSAPVVHMENEPNHSQEILAPRPQAPPPVLQPAIQAGAPGSSQNNPINIDDGEEIAQNVSSTAWPAETDLQTNVRNDAAGERHDSAVGTGVHSEILPYKPVDSSHTLPNVDKDGPATSYPTPPIDSSTDLETQHHGRVRDTAALSTFRQDGAAIGQPSPSYNEDLQLENTRKRKRNGPAIMPGMPASYSTPPTPFNAKTQLKKALGKRFDKYTWMETPTTPQQVEEPKTKPRKKPRKKDGPGEAERRALEVAYNDLMLARAGVNQKEAEDEDSSLEDELRAALAEDNQTTAGNDQLSLEDAIQAEFDEQAELDWLEATYFEPDPVYPSDDGELILEDPEDRARQYREDFERRKQAEAQEAAKWDDYLRAARAAGSQQEIDCQTEDDEESESDDDDDEDEMSEEAKAEVEMLRDVDEELEWSEEE